MQSRSITTTKKSNKVHADGFSALGVMAFLFVILLFAVGTMMFVNQNAARERVLARSEALAEQEAQASEENQQVKDLKNQIGSDAYTETVARDNLGMIKAGEVIFETEAK